MKCFLSHSNEDKAHYVSIVTSKLSPHVEYDEKTFEEGMGNLEEIMNAMSRSQIFVLFISDSSLKSKWVKKEITEAKKLLSSGHLKRFFPIIIEKTITYNDARIPTWIKETYNLRPITRPVVAAKRIRERMIEASWKSHPMLKKRDQIFVGRNTHIAKFEQRIDDFNKRQPLVIFASGLREIGRKTTMRHSLRKSNLVRETYDPSRIDLTQEDGIEGFIIKLNDLGLSDALDVSGLMGRDLKDKAEICAKLLADAFSAKEIILIEDHYCIVRYDREIAPWFLDVMEELDNETLGICVATSSKTAQYKYVRDERFYFMEIPELERAERDGLFKRYSEYLKLGLSRDDFKDFSPLLSGFPEQVTYAASLIESLGKKRAFDKADEIVSFSTYKASIFIKKYEEDEITTSFLRFISSFEFISLDFILYIENKLNKPLSAILDRLLADSVCEVIGSTGQYFRVNEVIRDAIVRDRAQLTSEYRTALRAFVEKFSSDYDTEYYDVSEYHIAVKQALTTGIELPESILIPAHFLKTMKDLYNKRNYREVIALADRVLIKSMYFDKHTSQDIRYFLCQSLARVQDRRFTSEVQKITGPEHDFLFGFYYRQQGRMAAAMERYESAMKEQRTEQRARREYVFVLTTIEAYEDALSLAKENYERYPSNPFLVQAYFSCLIHTSVDPGCESKLQEILSALGNIRGARANEMHDTLSARFEFQFGDKEKAFRMIDSTIEQYPDIAYPALTKLDMAIYGMRYNEISSCVEDLERGRVGIGHKIAVLKAKVVLKALEGDQQRALRMIDKDLKSLSKTAKEKLQQRVISVRTQKK